MRVSLSTGPPAPYILAADEDFDTHRFITLINGQEFDFDVGIPVTPQSVPLPDLLPSPGDPIEGDATSATAASP